MSARLPDIIGLTGGIASGKSTVARLLRERGEAVVDADVLAREVVQPGTRGLAAVTAAFGEEILAADGSLDRKRLGAIVFADAEKRAQLSAIVHPLVGAALTERLEELGARGVAHLVYEVPLLFENGLERGMACTVLVAAPEASQLERLMARDGLSEPDAQARIHAQLPLREKRARADFVLENAGDQRALREALDALWPRVLARLG